MDPTSHPLGSETSRGARSDDDVDVIGDQNPRQVTEAIEIAVRVALGLVEKMV